MDIPLVVAGSLAVLAAAIHGVGGELLVVRKLSLEMLPTTRFGRARMTKAMIHVSWHIATVAFLAVGVSLLLAGSVLDGDAAEGIALAAAGASTGFALVAVVIGTAHNRSVRALRNHPGPIVLSVIPVLAWWGAL